MKKTILLIIVLSMLISLSARASEIFGTISTNPNAPSGAGEDRPPIVEPLGPPAGTVPTPVIQNSGGAVILPIQNKQPEHLSSGRPEGVQSSASVPEVLGAKIYPDGTLLRSIDHKIYSIKGGTKKLISNLTELSRYRGQPIIDVSTQELSAYQNREHSNGELIRQRGQVKVYEIVKGGKHHVLNLVELRAHYSGREIFNISSEEMALY
jgi:hypothetical protein